MNALEETNFILGESDKRKTEKFYGKKEINKPEEVGKRGVVMKNRIFHPCKS